MLASIVLVSSASTFVGARHLAPTTITTFQVAPPAQTTPMLHVRRPATHHLVAKHRPVKPKGPADRLTASPIAGKGMWIWLVKNAEGGNPKRIVARARQLGLRHIYVRSSSSDSGMKFIHDLDRIVPIAHRAGIRVIAWDFVRLINPTGDAHRLAKVLDHRTPGGGKVDGVAADLETPAEGVHLTPARARAFAATLAHLKPNRYKILVPPRPSAWTTRIYPYSIARYFDAIAPMVYWIDADPIQTLRQTMFYFRRYHKPVAPIGQAYDPGLDGGPRGAPRGSTLESFAKAARNWGAIGVSFWSWQHATVDEFRSIKRISFPARK